MDKELLAVDQVPDLIRRLYKLVDEFESLFPGRPFTPDGHLVGSIGEVFASHYYEIELLPPSMKGHDAKTREGRLVEIKATQGKYVALRSEPDYLLVFLLHRRGAFEEIYNGPGNVIWPHVSEKRGNGQHHVTLSRLRDLNQRVSSENRIPKKRFVNPPS